MQGMQLENAPNRDNICSILYVEDSDAMAYLFQRALEHTGTDVRLYRVADGESALTFLHRQDVFQSAPRPDIVVLDLNLPKKSGFEVLEEIGGSDALKELPVVVFSSSSRPADRERALALGARAFFLKASELEDFVATAKSICELAHPERYWHRYRDPEAQYIDYRLPVLGIRLRKNSCQIISRIGNDWVPVGRVYDLPITLPPKDSMPAADSRESVLLIAWRYERAHPDTDLRKLLTGEQPVATALADHS
jgi:CheY-like chemotaxis protein